MKKIFFLSALAILAVACQVEPYSQDSDGEYLVYTQPAKDVDFASYMTFDIADSLLVIGQSEKPQYSQSNNALALIQAAGLIAFKQAFIAVCILLTDYIFRVIFFWFVGVFKCLKAFF